jgi:hypothetical protein
LLFPPARRPTPDSSTVSAVRPRSVAELAAPSPQRLLALAWLKFFLFGMRTVFGPIAAAGSAALFQLADASIMPLLSGVLAYEGKRQAAALRAALIVVPQLLVALLMPWVGRSAEKHDRKPLLTARRVCRPTNPRSAVCFDQDSSGLGSDPIAGRHPGIGRSDDGSGHRRCNDGQSRAGIFGTVMGAPLSVRPFRV